MTTEKAIVAKLSRSVIYTNLPCFYSSPSNAIPSEKSQHVVEGDGIAKKRSIVGYSNHS